MSVFYKHEIKRIDDLRISKNNARTHSEKQIDQICNSINEFGFTNPILINSNGEIIAGHGRYDAAKQLKYEEVPCIVIDDLTEMQQRALMLADNRLALNAGWDNEILSQELTALNAEGLDLLAIGFSQAEIADLVVPAAGGNDPDAAPVAPVTPTTRLGDVYLLGDHRLVCGDSTSGDSYAAVMQNELADGIWTDPPYNVNYGEKVQFLNKRGKGNRIQSKIINDHLSHKAFAEFLRRAFSQIQSHARPGASIYVAHSETERATFTSEFLSAGFSLSGVIVWKKNALVLGRSDYHWIHEPILYGWKNGGPHAWYGGRRRTTVAEIMQSASVEPINGGGYLVITANRAFTLDGTAIASEVATSVIVEKKPQVSKDHPTMKPVALIERMLINSTKRGDIVLDPFGGSGSTLIAAERLGLRARLIELAPGYCDVIVRRWEEFTGKTADVRRAD